MDMQQEEIISYLQVAHSFWTEGTLNGEELDFYIDEIPHDMSIVDYKRQTIKFIYKDDWYPTLIFIHGDGRVTVTHDIDYDRS